MDLSVVFHPVADIFQQLPVCCQQIRDKGDQERLKTHEQQDGCEDKGLYMPVPHSQAVKIQKAKPDQEPQRKELGLRSKEFKRLVNDKNPKNRHNRTVDVGENAFD